MILDLGTFKRVNCTSMKETGTDITYWAGKAHYLRDAFVIFEEQYPGWLAKVLLQNPNFIESIKINNYQWFTYGRSPLDSLREGDRAADYMDKYCTNQNRIMQSSFSQAAKKSKSSIDSEVNSKIQFWPNPATDYLSIKSDTKISSLTLMDSKMKKIEYKLFNKNEIQFDINNLSKGIYYIELSYDDESDKLIKFVKQ